MVVLIKASPKVNQLNIKIMEMNLNASAANMVATHDSTMEDKFFDFEKAKTQAITLDQLGRTYRENDVYGNPLKGIYIMTFLAKSYQSVKKSVTM